MPGFAVAVLSDVFVPFSLVDIFDLHQVHDAKAAAPNHIIHGSEFAVLLQELGIEQLLEGDSAHHLTKLLVRGKFCHIALKGFI